MFIPDKIEEDIEPSESSIKEPDNKKIVKEESQIDKPQEKEPQVEIKAEETIIEPTTKKVDSSTNNIIKEEKNILVLKKSPIETKIFSSIISKICDKVDMAKDSNEFLDKIKNNYYKVIIFDKDIKDISFADIPNIIKSENQKAGNKSSASILFANPNDTIQDNIKSLFDEIVSNAITKDSLEELIKS